MSNIHIIKEKIKEQLIKIGCFKGEDYIPVFDENALFQYDNTKCFLINERYLNTDLNTIEYKDGDLYIQYYRQKIYIFPFIMVKLTKKDNLLDNYGTPTLCLFVNNLKYTYIQKLTQTFNINFDLHLMLYNDDNFKEINRSIFRDIILKEIGLNHYTQNYLANMLYYYYEIYKVRCIERIDISKLL